MADIAIDVQGLSKRYRIGSAEKMHDTLGGALADIVTRPVKNLRHLRSLSSFGKDGGSESVIWALKDVSFQVKHGEVIGVIGPNGAGKSTLLKVLSRITDPTEGRVVTRGRMSSLLEVGTGFHPELTGRENVYLNATILGMRRKEVERKFDAIVDFSGVEKFIDTPVKRYSSGMKVRLAFAVAAHLEPEILLVDEVLAVGDAEFQRRCLGKMDDVAKEGRTVLFVSHNMGAVQSLTSRCICLEGGRIAVSGPTTEAIEQYLNSIEIADDSYDFTNARRQAPVHGQDIRIRSIIPKQPHEGGFYWGQDLSFEVELESHMKHSYLRFGATIADIAGGVILSTFSPKVISTPPSGRVSYHFVIQEPRLAPGTYTLALSIGEGGQDEVRLDYDVVNPGPVFSVAPTAPDATAIFKWSRAYGPIVHSKCTITCP
jgi:lipopolysaccharide transport system ATP-binding protein